MYAVTGEKNVVQDPGFESSSNSCLGWTNIGTTGGGIIKPCDPTKYHSGSQSTLLNATRTVGVAQNKDAVRAVVNQQFPTNANPPSVDTFDSRSDGFSAWWYVDPISMTGMPVYSLHFQVQLYDPGSGQYYTVEYWYGISDLANSTNSRSYYLGNMTIGQWFETTRDLTRDVKGLGVSDPSKIVLSEIWFGAFGDVNRGERAFLDDVSLWVLPHPVPLISATPVVGSAPLTVNLDGSSSSITGGGSGVTITNYVWSFGDGSPNVTGLSNVRTSHTYNNQGTFTVTLTVVDSNGQSRSTSSQIVVSASEIWQGPAIAAGFAGILAVGAFLVFRRPSRGTRLTGSKRKR